MGRILRLHASFISTRKPSYNGLPMPLGQALYYYQIGYEQTLEALGETEEQAQEKIDKMMELLRKK